MKKLIEYLQNCWKIEDLRQRILITILFVAIYRFGSFVVLPGINLASRYVLRWSIFSCVNLRTGNHAIHLSLYRYAASGSGSALLPEDAARR